MCTTPSAPPERARCTAAESDPLRPVSTRSSIGSEAPDTPSMRPSSSRRETTLPGVAPKMSVSTRTPSPASRPSSSSRARSTRSSGSSWRQTLSVATCCGAAPRIWLALVSSASPMLPWVTTRPPIKRVSSCHFLLQRVEEHARHVEAGLVLDLAEAGGARDVDFGEIVADHVESHDQQSPFSDDRTHGRGNFLVPVTQRLGDPARALGEIAARVAALRNARQAMRDHFPVDQDYAFVALRDLGDVAL